MDINQQKEQFSIAYVRAVAATAGYTTYRPEVDDDSVDMGIARRGGGGTIRSPKLEFQLKCADRDSSEVRMTDDTVAYRLKLKNYNELRVDEYQVPRVLVLVLVPPGVGDWLEQTVEKLAMNSCGYWVSLVGKPEVSIQGDKTTVHFPKPQMFDVTQVDSIMDRVANGGKP